MVSHSVADNVCTGIHLSMSDCGWTSRCFMDYQTCIVEVRFMMKHKQVEASHC